jgi:Zn-dependent peptidase ImmA (M78 family)
MSKVPPAEALLQNLGICQPCDIDLEVIAWHLGVKVKYRQLASCEARIVALGDRGIITVDDRKPHERQRFSLGHELGHWHHHRGRCLVCRSDEIGVWSGKALDPERVADSYASDLLLPWYLFKPVLRSFRRPSLAALREIKATFEVSLTAAAYRIIDSDQFPMMLVIHGDKKRKSFRPSRSVPSRWFPRDELDQDSQAFDILYGKAKEKQHPSKIGADAWFDRRGADQHEILEQSFALPGNEVATLLIFEDEEMLSE